MIDDGGDYHITYKLFYNDLQGRNQVLDLLEFTDEIMLACTNLCAMLHAGVDFIWPARQGSDDLPAAH